MAQPLTDAINALTRYANEVTGASDQTLSDAVRTLCDGYGGGGSGIQLVDTITVPEDTRSYSFDLTAYADYDTVIVTEDLELSGSDWLYYVVNGSSPSGGQYDGFKHVRHQWVMCARMRLGGNSSKDSVVYAGMQSFASVSINTVVNNIFIYTYNASNKIKAGSTFNVYAGNIF